MSTNETAYLRGRADERESIIGWLRAEAKAEFVPGWKHAFEWVVKALSNLDPESEFDGLVIQRMELPDEY